MHNRLSRVAALLLGAVYLVYEFGRIQAGYNILAAAEERQAFESTIDGLEQQTRRWSDLAHQQRLLVEEIDDHLESIATALEHLRRPATERLREAAAGRDHAGRRRE